jgi:hypothetical protein
MSESKKRWKELVESFNENDLIKIDALEEKLKDDGVASKIVKVIQSCMTHNHLMGAVKMTTLYFNNDNNWVNGTNKAYVKFILTRHLMKKFAEIEEEIDL